MAAMNAACGATASIWPCAQACTWRASDSPSTSRRATVCASASSASAASAWIATAGWRGALRSAASMLMKMYRMPAAGQEGAGAIASMKRLPITSTTSASSNSGRPASALMASGWRADSAPRPLSLITTGAPRRSASRCSGALAAAAITPPPTYSTGKRAWSSRAAARSMSACSGAASGATTGAIGAAASSALAISRSKGTSTPTGRGRPLCIAVKAASMVGPISLRACTRAFHLVRPAIRPVWSLISCRLPYPLPTAAEWIWPARNSSLELAP